MSEPKPPRKYPLGTHGLSYVLLTLFLIAWAIQTWTGWNDFSGEAESHGEAAKWLGEGGYIWHWLAQTMENWQSEFLQLLAFATLTSFLIHKGSPESRDSEDEDRETLQRIESRLSEIEKKIGVK